MPRCSDGVVNGEETGVDCGGLCRQCGIGVACAHGGDCTTGICQAGACRALGCFDGQRNGSESDVDCGGTCPPCANGGTCANDGDCVTASCVGGTCVEPSCADGKRNQHETGIDCGGECATCQAGAGCQVPTDCGSLVCTEGVCRAPRCADDVQNGLETDVDCGGNCLPCTSGLVCDVHADCAGGRCVQSVCVVAACDDGLLNGTETDVDCGGACTPCVASQSCRGHADCDARVCLRRHCERASCQDGVRNGSEVDVDCGGSCGACGAGKRCLSLSGCRSGVCPQGVCRAPACDDGVKNGTETDLNCGSACGPCRDGLRCSVNIECVSGVCPQGVCLAPACDDGVKNGPEADVDCAGTCALCENGQRCTQHGNCQSNVCWGGRCQALGCGDGVHNGDESSRDCGGSCAPCGAGHRCNRPWDCESQLCVLGLCALARCDDTVKNGTETDLNCGGNCARCGSGQACGTASDCDSRVCVNLVCAAPSCDDGVANGTESDVNCGGTCPPCADTKLCRVDGNCQSGVCSRLHCQRPVCDDHVVNGQETDVDCGGTCDKCRDTLGCDVPRDCASGVCKNDVCARPSCFDDIANGQETDVNCGGSCGKCDDHRHCVVPEDCKSGVCEITVCQPSSCADDVQNGTEADVDCGGPDCGPCAAGKGCGHDNHCLSRICTNDICQTASCTDLVQNQDESDVDCGRSCPTLCDPGKWCRADVDCSSLHCVSPTCAEPTCDDQRKNGDEIAKDCGGVCPTCGDDSFCENHGDCQSGRCIANACAAPTCQDGVQNRDEGDVDCGGAYCGDCLQGASCSDDDDCDTRNCSASVCFLDLRLNPQKIEIVSASPGQEDRVQSGHLAIYALSGAGVAYGPSAPGLSIFVENAATQTRTEATLGPTGRVFASLGDNAIERFWIVATQGETVWRFGAAAHTPFINPVGGPTIANLVVSHVPPPADTPAHLGSSLRLDFTIASPVNLRERPRVTFAGFAVTCSLAPTEMDGSAKAFLCPYRVTGDEDSSATAAWVVRATDVAGNSASAQTTYRLDATPPEVTLAVPAQTTWDGRPGISGFVADDFSGVAKVYISIQDADLGTWWRGVDFRAGQQWHEASLDDDAWSFATTLPYVSGHGYRVYLEGVDVYGSRSTAAAPAAFFTYRAHAPVLPESFTAEPIGVGALRVRWVAPLAASTLGAELVDLVSGEQTYHWAEPDVLSLDILGLADHPYAVVPVSGSIAESCEDRDVESGLCVFTELTPKQARPHFWRWVAPDPPSAGANVLLRLDDETVLGIGIGDQPIVSRSTDGGRTFTLSQLPWAITLSKAVAVGQHVVACGTGGLVESLDGGKSWARTVDELAGFINCRGISAADGVVLAILRDSSGFHLVVRSPIDGSWAVVVPVGVEEPPLRVLARNGGGGVLLMSTQFLYSETPWDAESWQRANVDVAPEEGWASRGDVDGNDHAIIAVGETLGSLYRSVDEGRSYVRQQLTVTQNYFSDVCVAGSEVVLVAHTQLAISTNSGASWTLIDVDPSPYNFMNAQRLSDGWLLTGYRSLARASAMSGPWEVTHPPLDTFSIVETTTGEVMTTPGSWSWRDRGGPWTTTAGRTWRRGVSGLHVNGELVVVPTDSGAWMSPDFGRTFQTVAWDFLPEQIAARGDSMVVVGNNSRRGVIWRADARGAGGTEISGPLVTDLNYVAGLDTQYIALAGDGNVLQSPEGLVWTTAAVHLEYVPRPGETSGLVAQNGQTTVILDGEDVVISTDFRTWDRHALPGYASSIGVTAAGTFLVVGAGIVRSADGITWERVSLDPAWGSRFSDVTRVDNLMFVSSGESGGITLLRSADDGLTWRLPVLNAGLCGAVPCNFSVDGAIGGSLGALFLSTRAWSMDAGLSWTVAPPTVPIPYLGPKLSMHVYGPANAIAAAGNAVLRLSADESVVTSCVDTCDSHCTSPLSCASDAALYCNACVVGCLGLEARAASFCAPPTCDDGLQNGFESAQDCGGACEPCDDGETCRYDSDCQSGNCDDDVCAQFPCDDRIKNGSESDIDCGGSCALCTYFEGCRLPSDCVSGVCTLGQCEAPASCGDGRIQAPEVCDDGIKNGIGDLLCSPDCTVKPRCGDGVVNGHEHCEPADLGCMANCLRRPKWLQVSGHSGTICGVSVEQQVWCWGSVWAAYGGAYNVVMLPVITQPRRFSHVAAGSHTCAIDLEAGLWCWGSNSDGQVGNSQTTTPARPFRVSVNGLRWRDVQVVNRGTCALSTEDTGSRLFCWGWNLGGRFGAGAPLNAKLPPTEVGGSWRTIGLGNYQTCAIDMTGNLYCSGNYGMGGQSRQSSTPVLIDVPGVRFQSVAPAANHICALDTTGALWCYGENRLGQLGVDPNPTTPALENAPSMVRVSVGPWRLLQTTDHNTTAGPSTRVVSETAVRVFGDPFVRIGNGFTTLLDESFALSGVSHIVGHGFVCALDDAGSLHCWGSPGRSVFGTGPTPTSAASPQLVSGAWDDLSRHVGAGIKSGRVWLWGSAHHGRLGAGRIVASDIPVPLEHPGPFAQVTMSGSAMNGGACGVLGETHRLMCWGRIGSVDYGGGALVGDSAWTLIDLAFGLNAASACAIDRLGALYCWGYTTPLLGGSSLRTPTPVAAPAGIWTDIAVGESHACGILGREVYCWGQNAFGQLGQGDTTARTTPTRVLEGGWSRVSTGSDHSCGIGESAGLYCWGNNWSGKSGRPESAGHQLLPVAVGAPETRWRDLCLLSRLTCAVREDGTLWCFGDYTMASGRHVPTQIGTAANWGTLSCGSQTICGLRDDILWCFGDNRAGEFGDGLSWQETPLRIE